MSNPYQTPQFAQTEIAAASVIDREKLRRIARYQQWVLYALLVNIVINIVALATQNQGLLIALTVLVVLIAVVIFAMVAVFLLANELFNPVIGVLCALLMIVPCISLLTLLVINGRATKHLQTHGIKVGFMGANPNSI
jgi:hypothetical protein